MIRDFNIEWLEKRVFIPWSGFGGAVGQIVDATDASEDTAFRTYVSATSKAAQIAASLVAGLSIGAQNDGVAGMFMFPDLDITKQVRFRVHFNTTADNGDATWVVQYLPIVGNTTVIAEPATALSTPIPVYNTAIATDNVWRVTDFGIIARNTLLSTMDAIILEVRCTDAAPLTALAFLGLEIRYTPRRTAGPRRNILGGRRLNTSFPLGVQLASSQEGL